MRISELAAAVHRARKNKLDRIMLTMPIPKRWDHWKRRVKTPFGMCECYPSGDGLKILFYPTVEQVIKYLEKL